MYSQSNERFIKRVDVGQLLKTKSTKHGYCVTIMDSSNLAIIPPSRLKSGVMKITWVS